MCFTLLSCKFDNIPNEIKNKKHEKKSNVEVSFIVKI